MFGGDPATFFDGVVGAHRIDDSEHFGFDAATVVLVAEGSGSLSDANFEVLVVRRPQSMRFAPGCLVFPGGTVDDEDLSQDEPKDAGRVADLRRVAVREVFEEVGLRLEVGDLVPFARWITPIGRPRRFDTRFFLAKIDAEQMSEIVLNDGEIDEAIWAAPSRILELEPEELPRVDLSFWPLLLPPTRRTLEALRNVESTKHVDQLPEYLAATFA